MTAFAARRATIFTIVGGLLFVLSGCYAGVIREITLRVYLRPVFEQAQIAIEPALLNAYAIVNWMRGGFFFEAMTGLAMIAGAMKLRRGDDGAPRMLRIASLAVLIIPVIAIVMADLASHRLVIVAPRPIAAMQWLSAFHESSLIILGITSAACGALLSLMAPARSA
jgi:hypothetical protein